MIDSTAIRFSVLFSVAGALAGCGGDEPSMRESIGTSLSGTAAASSVSVGSSGAPESESTTSDGQTSTAGETESSSTAVAAASSSSSGGGSDELTTAPENPQCVGQPRVLYMDDGGVPNDDPNGVQDLAIVLGWADEVDLLAIGSTSWNEGSAAFLEQIVSEAGSTIPVLTEEPFIVRLIEEARSMAVCDTARLHVAIGGEWFKLQKALERAPDIAPYIRVAGIAGWNIRPDATPEGVPREAYDAIVAAIGEDAIFRIDDKNDGAPELPDFRDAYEVEPGYSVADLDAFYDTNLRPLLSRIPDPSNPALNISEESSFYISHTRLLNLGQGEGDGQNGSKLRIADFLTIAYIAWGEDPSVDIFDKDHMYPRIAAGLATLR